MAVIGVTCPAYLPPDSTGFWHSLQWRSDGVLDQIMTTWHSRVRQQAQKNHSGPGCCSSTSLAVKNTCNASVEFSLVLSLQMQEWERVLGQRICPKISHHQTPSRRRYALDYRFLRTALLPVCPMTKAGIELLSHHLDYFRAKPVNIPKITILLDNGYHPDKITTALQGVYPQMMTKIRLELAPKPTNAEKAAQGKTGFVPVAVRWGKRTVECLDGTL